MNNRLITGFAGTLLVFVSGIILTYRLPQQLDVIFGDETTYLYSALTYTFPPDPYLAQWGSIYAAWYAFLRVFQPDTLNLYYLSWQLLITLVGTLLFLYLYLRKSGLLTSVFCALCLQFFAKYSVLDPRISILVLCVMLAGLSGVQAGRKKPQTILIITAVTALVCAYIRPEFYVSFLLAAVLAVAMSFRPGLRAENRFGQLAVLAVIAGAMQWALGNPLTGSDRSFDAFRQHFILNYSAWTGQPNPNTIERQFEIFSEVYGSDTKSVTDAFRSRPDLVIRHFLTNIYNTILADARLLGALFYETPFTYLPIPAKKWLAALLVTILLAVLVDFPATFRGLGRPIRAFSSRELALLILLLPTLVSVVLVYPRTHYLFFHALGLITVVAFFLKHTRLRVGRPRLVFGLFGGALGVWLVFHLSMNQYTKPTPIADNIRFIRSLPLTGPVASLEREWYRVFLYRPDRVPKWVHVEAYTGNSDFGRFVQQQGVNFILMTRDMQQYFGNDTGVSSFVASGSAPDFVRFKTPEPGSFLLVRRDLLPLGVSVSSRRETDSDPSADSTF